MAANPNEFIPTRQSLLGRLKNWDDEQSWKEFFNTYWKLIYSVAVKSGLSDAEAQDVVQETVLAVAKRMPNFQYRPEGGSFKAWLLQITRRTIGHRLRKRSAVPPAQARQSDDATHTPTVERIPDPGSLNPDAVWEEEWQKNLVDAAMKSVKRKVKPKQYQMFDSYVVKEWPVQRVCKILHVSAAQVYLAKFRVSALIRREIKRLETKMG